VIRNISRWVGHPVGKKGGAIVGSGTRKTIVGTTTKGRTSGKRRSRKKEAGNGGGANNGNDIQKAYRQLSADHRILSGIVDVLRRECAEAQEYLTAAGAPEAERIPERLVLVAKEWFHSHATSSGDHISVRLRGLLLKAGEVDFIYVSGPRNL
jgi:hypothetical protein